MFLVIPVTLVKYRQHPMRSITPAAYGARWDKEAVFRPHRWFLFEGTERPCVSLVCTLSVPLGGAKQ